MVMSNAERQRRHRARIRLKKKLLESKREAAAIKGVALIEGALFIHDAKGDFAVLQWDEEKEDFLITHRGRLDEVPPKG